MQSHEGFAWTIWIRRIYAILLAAIGATLVFGGTWLIVLGGSPYYLPAGLSVVVAAVLVWRGNPFGARVYGAMLVVTLAWSIFEVGFDPWQLVARMFAPSVLALPLLFGKRGADDTSSPASPSGWRAAIAAILVAALVGVLFHALAPGREPEPVWVRGKAAVPAVLGSPIATPGEDWRNYGNDLGGTRFSPLAQIDTANVASLKPAWVADVDTGPGIGATLQVTPLDIGDALYLCNAHNGVVALDAENGRQRWRFDMSDGHPATGKPCRGVAYYHVPGASGPCADRILAASQTPELFALDMRTGRPCVGFGLGGHVALLDGMGPTRGYYFVTSAPQVIRGKVVLGGAVLDGQYWGEPSGVVRAFDAVTGRLAWAFDTGRRDDGGPPPAGKTYTPSTPNSWAPISADEQLGLVYLPIGNATPDYYGAQRRPFDDDISSSVIALDAETGRLRWRFQTVHHDLWDYDVGSQPTLVDLPVAGGVRHALIQPTKRGEIFVLDRETGEPIKRVQERPVPRAGALPGERVSPTQPFSVEMPSFRGPVLRESDMWGLTPLDQLYCRIRFAQSDYQGLFTPPSLGRTTLVDPGYSGGIDWGSVSIDVRRGIMLVNWMNMPHQVEVVSRAEGDARGFTMYDASKGFGPPYQPMGNTPYAAKASPFLSPLGVPCTAPPWGYLTAVDLGTGRAIWSRKLGTGRDSGPFGLRSHLPFTMGVPNSGGSLTTGGGLVFIGAAADSRLRAFDTASGSLLWETDLPGAGIASPMSYHSPRSGRQFIVIAAGGRTFMKTRMSTKMVAYALPPSGAVRP